MKLIGGGIYKVQGFDMRFLCSNSCLQEIHVDANMRSVFKSNKNSNFILPKDAKDGDTCYRLTATEPGMQIINQSSPELAYKLGKIVHSQCGHLGTYSVIADLEEHVGLVQLRKSCKDQYNLSMIGVSLMNLFDFCNSYPDMRVGCEYNTSFSKPAFSDIIKTAPGNLTFVHIGEVIQINM